jgi:hypothetical protein
MEDLPKDVLFSLALEMDLPDLLRFCSSHPKINRKVCSNNNIWRTKLLKEYPLLDISGVVKPKELYFWLNEKAKIIHISKFDKTKEKNIVSFYDTLRILTDRGLDAIKNGKNIDLDVLYGLKRKLQFPNVSPNFFGIEELKIPDEKNPKIVYSMVVISPEKNTEIRKNNVEGKSFVTGPFGEIYPIFFKSKEDSVAFISSKLLAKIIGKFYNGSIIIF